MLNVTNLHAEIDGKPILKGLSRAMGAGETPGVMGLNEAKYGVRRSKGAV